jgi:hypothetical protein
MRTIFDKYYFSDDNLIGPTMEYSLEASVYQQIKVMDEVRIFKCFPEKRAHYHSHAFSLTIYFIQNRKKWSVVCLGGL